MNTSILALGSAIWALLFLQAIHITPDDSLAPYFFFGAGVAQWVCGVCFVGAVREFRHWRDTF